MTTRSRSLFAAIAALAATLAFSAADAAPINAGRFSGTDCSGGAFANCHAETTGTSQDAPGSPSIYKLNYNSGSFGSPAFGSFQSIDGSEFQVSFDTSSHVLTWTYTPGASDPEIHYFTIKQGNSYTLFYDLTSPITSFTLDLDTIGYNSLSHITWFDTGSTQTNVPGPNALALLGLGLLGLGMAARRRA
jgi:hypothetical protein